MGQSKWLTCHSLIQFVLLNLPTPSLSSPAPLCLVNRTSFASLNLGVMSTTAEQLRTRPTAGGVAEWGSNWSEPGTAHGASVDEPHTGQRMGESGYDRIASYNQGVENAIDERRVTEKSQRILDIASSFGKSPASGHRRIQSNNRVVPGPSNPLREAAQRAMARPGPPTQAQVVPESDWERQQQQQQQQQQVPQQSNQQDVLRSARSETADQDIATADLWEI